MTKSFTLLAAVLTVLATSVQAGPWFTHRFGELRAYHKDWLNVCEDNGAGACRAVQYKLPESGETVFGESRLALLHQGGDAYAIDVYDRGLIPQAEGDLVFDFGSARVVLTSEQWRAGDAKGINVAETVTVTQAEDAAKLVALIRAKSRLTVQFVVEDAPTAEAQFSLRGSAAALNAIEAHKAQ